MEENVTSTNSLTNPGAGDVVSHLPSWLQPEWLRIALIVILAPLIYYLMLSLGRRLKRRHGVKLGILYHAFSLGCGVFLISLVDRYVWELYFKQIQNLDVPKFLPEVVRLGILILAVFWALHHFYGQTVSGLIIAPGIAAVVIGFAMQDSLGNIISGIALQAGKPYAHGDWLLVDNRYAEVIEVNWRATRLRTHDDVVIEIPHRQMASQTIVNLNRPTRRHAVRVSVGIDSSAPPSRVRDVLLHATSNAKGVSPEPKPRV